MAVETTDTLRAELDQLRTDLHDLRQDVGKATGSLYNTGRQSVNAAGQQARDYTEASTKYVRDSVNERPITAVLVAAGAGVVLGALLRQC